jgi:hypothetical protein
MPLFEGINISGEDVYKFINYTYTELRESRVDII